MKRKQDNEPKSEKQQGKQEKTPVDSKGKTGR